MNLKIIQRKRILMVFYELSTQQSQNTFYMYQQYIYIRFIQLFNDFKFISFEISDSNDSIFISILNSVIPVVTYVVVGYILYITKIFDNQKTLLNITFNFTFPISLIYSIGITDLEAQDLKVMISFWVSSILVVPFIILQVKLFDKQKQIMAFAHLYICINILNILITGLPLTQGFYDQKLAEKYSYIITFSQFIINYPLAYFFFAYGEKYYKNTGTKLSRKTICKLVGQAILTTLKNPMIIAIAIALIYNLIRSVWWSALDSLPYYFSKFFTSLSVLTRSFGVPPIGIFMGGQIDSLRNKKNKQKQIELNQQIINEDLGNTQLSGDENKNIEEEWSICKQMLYLIFTAVIRHILFPLFGVIMLIILKTDNESIKVLSSLFTCNSGLQSFSTCNQYGIHETNAGFMILLGIIFTIVFTALYKVILEALGF